MPDPRYSLSIIHGTISGFNIPVDNTIESTFPIHPATIPTMEVEGSIGAFPINTLFGPVTDNSPIDFPVLNKTGAVFGDIFSFRKDRVSLFSRDI